MKKEEPSIGLVRGKPSSLEETIGSLSRPGCTATALIEKPALSLISESLMGGSGRCIQPRTCFPDATRAPDLSPSSNRRMRTRMYGGVRRAVSDGRPYPIYPDCRTKVRPPLSSNSFLYCIVLVSGQFVTAEMNSTGGR